MSKTKDFFNSLPAKSIKILKSDGAKKTYSSLFCILVSLIIGIIFLLCMDAPRAFPEFINMISGGMTFGGINFFAILAKTAPLLCCGLSIVFANKSGMFNIGVAGQYTIGVFASLMFALQFNMSWIVCMLFAMIFGAIWAIIPGILKAYCNVSEVLSGIMLNWVALFFTNYSFQTYLSDCVNGAEGAKTFTLFSKNPSALLPDIGLRASTNNYFSIGIFIALIAAVVIWFLLSKTTFGFQVKGSGLNKEATKYAGMKGNRNIIVSMAISGCLAGLGASLYYLAGLEQWSVQASSALPGLPWNGIVVAFVGQLSPIGTIFASIFVTLISHGSRFMLQTSFPAEISDLVTGLIVYLSGLSNLAIILLNKYVFSKKKVSKKDCEMFFNNKNDDVNSNDSTNIISKENENISKEEKTEDK
ncbi:MAG: ABC transporter permease [Firmicutes bacterium]|uniref:ABC transporter permease n=1 Tax=Candidatus Onthovivens merdipullorum TaxID=2840889 RepID=A0A9D9GTX6_9BACL|nr:ABC transporter permease [Candidatus Onthovivens merdipullorum]